MKITAAITEAEASNPMADTVSSIVPQLRILTGTKGFIAGGKPGFVGAASAEAKITGRLNRGIAGGWSRPTSGN